MACLSPVGPKGLTRPCRRCDGCRRSRRLVVVSRLLLEGLAHERACMTTMTYADPYLPTQLDALSGEVLRRGGDGVPTVAPIDVRRFMFRLRRHLAYHGGPSVRSFTVMEYGGRFDRPHVHQCLFGIDGDTVVNGRRFGSTRSGGMVVDQGFCESQWGHGQARVGHKWTARAAVYCSGYISKGDHGRLSYDPGTGEFLNRLPETILFPQRPGLGVPGLCLILPKLLDGREVRELVAVDGDIRSKVFLSDRERVLGSYLLRKARELAGLTPDEVADLHLRRRREESFDARNAWLVDLVTRSLGSADPDTADAVIRSLQAARAACASPGVSAKVRATRVTGRRVHLSVPEWMRAKLAKRRLCDGDDC